MITTIMAGQLYANTQSKETSENIQQLDAIVIKANQQQDISQAKQDLKKVSGATNLVDLTEQEQGRLASTADLFTHQAGIYAQTAGNEGVKVSIRGSGINRAPGAHASGIHVLLDDIPFTGPGGTPYELLEPLWLNRIEVLRGANGFDQGATALGGAIHYVSKTGKNSAGSNVRLEMGSRGYQKYALSTGQQLNNLDYYIAVSGAQYHGYQQQAETDSKGISANVGYQINDNVETRFYLRYRETEHETPGRLTKQQIKNDPTVANSYNLQYDTRRIQPGSTWLANKTTFKFDDGAKLMASFAYHQYPMDLRESPYRTDVTYSDLTTSWVYNKPYTLFNLDSMGKVLFRSTTHRPNSGVLESLRFPVNGYTPETITRKYSYRGSDNVLQFSNDLALNDKLWLNTGLAGIYTHRENEVYYPVTNAKISQYEWNFAPRMGLRYDYKPDIQLYANYSGSVEPAHPWSMIWGSNLYFPAGSGPSAGRQRAPVHLSAQKAHTIEVGGRGESVLGLWDASYYYAQLKKELLMVEVSPLPNLAIAESNASDTIHQGLELALESPLWAYPTLGDLSLRQAYNYSDFHYKNDAVFGKNQLAGIPKHYYQAQLKLAHPSGVYAQINTEYASKIAVDYANSFYADAYQIWGLSFGYEAPNRTWNTWIDFKNLGDKHYAATVTPGYNDNGTDAARSTPGEGFSTYAGISMNF